MEPVFYIVGGIAIIFLGRVLTNWYHEIEKRNRYMEAQIKLLMHIAAANGVDKDKVAEIIAQAKLPLGGV